MPGSPATTANEHPAILRQQARLSVDVSHVSYAMTHREAGSIALLAKSNQEGKAMATGKKWKYKISAEHCLAAGRTAGALLLGNAALIVANDFNHWQNALKVVALGLVLIIMCSLGRTKATNALKSDNDSKEKL